MRIKVGTIILLVITAVITAVILELGKNAISDWLIAGSLFIVFIALYINSLYDKPWLWRTAGWIAFLIILFGVVKFLAPPFKQIPAVDIKNPKATEVVTIAQGQLTGVYNEDESVEVYTGIPYAKPPVGELRWKEPVEPDGWEGVRVCDHFAPMSMQAQNSPRYDSLLSIFGFHNFKISLKDNFREAVSEDSLYLNIWKPAGDVKDAPVLVYIHGGSLMTGQPSYSEYRGEDLAKKGIIVVNFGYRLGVFGYFANEELAAESPNATTGNYGLLDQIQALKWVQQNISAFGGDPEQVTIAGESAGASSVNALCVSPLSKGLFVRAIAESSGITAREPYHTFRSFDDALKMGQDIMDEFGVKSIDELRKIDASKLVGTKYQNSAMTLDGYAITEQPYLTYEKGENHEEALLNGFNVHEADIFNMAVKVNEDNYAETLKKQLGDYAGEATALFPAEPQEKAYKYIIDAGGDAKGSYNRVMSAIWFTYSHYKWSNYLKEQGRPVYEYYFTKDNKSLGSNHAGELPYAYGNLWRHAWLYDEKDVKLSEAMTEYWVNFVKTGDPNGDGLPRWQQFAEDDTKVFELGENIGMIDEPYLKLYEVIDKYQQSK